MTKTRHLLSITDLSKKEILHILNTAIKLKRKRFSDKLKGKTLAMIFEKPSLRTRLSFEAGMTQFGGHAIYLAPSDIQMGSRESISDVSKVVASMADAIMARTFKHETVTELAKYSSVPVINGLSDIEHPCQILADLQTIMEVKKKLTGLTLTYVGDAENNVTHSLVLACAILGMKFNCASPKGYNMDSQIVGMANVIGKKTGFKLLETESPEEAVKNSDVIITDTWVSMGDESEKDKRLKVFRKYQVNTGLMKLAKKSAIFMHCLPAHRDYEVTTEVIDGPQSVVFQEAENRLHAQKALLLFLLGKL